MMNLAAKFYLTLKLKSDITLQNIFVCFNCEEHRQV